MSMRSTGALKGIFTKPPEMMADILSSRELFPGGPATGLHILSIYISYASRRLSGPQRRSLERAKEMLINRVREICPRKAA